MTTPLYTLIQGQFGGTLTVIIDDHPHTIRESHPSYEQVRDSLVHGPVLDDAEYVDLITVSPVTRALRELETKHPGVNLTYDGSDLTVVGRQVTGPVYKRLVRSIDEDEPAQTDALLQFIQRLHRNPSFTARRGAYAWLEEHRLDIAQDGRVVGFKGLTAAGTSHRAGGAFVGGSWVDGVVPNLPGSNISLPREDVSDDMTRACHVGLHVGSFDYAMGYHGGMFATVVFDPADIVSVTQGAEKIRVCRYRVADITSLTSDNLDKASLVKLT